ncbi:MAG: methylated-DNA--[protein]-cysteine S-methyltransferase [Anaerolineales bacterium]|jgi:methylated-DNA-[protein]-cysteine S-methyltransferase
MGTDSDLVWIGLAKNTPLGAIWTAISDRGLVGVKLGGSRQAFTADISRQLKSVQFRSGGPAATALDQIYAYLSGKLFAFSLAIDWTGCTHFKRLVLEATMAVPYGATISYGELARQVGRPKAARAVGRAQATNPAPLVIPCHRVIGQDGSLRGYSGPQGVATKAWLLELERAHVRPKSRG